MLLCQQTHKTHSNYLLVTDELSLIPKVIASNEVIIQLIKTKCFPVLYYGLEACPLRKSQYNSIDYVISSSFRKVFDIKSQEVIDLCLGMFNCLPALSTCLTQKKVFEKIQCNG